MRILVLQHLEVEHPGVFRKIWSEDGHALTAIELDQGETIPALDDFDLMVAMGGPMDVWEEDLHPWLAEEKAVIKRWVEDLERPFFGICLGHQLLASALGGTVVPMRRPEVGLVSVELTASGASDPLMAGISQRLQAFQWHGAEVLDIPRGGVTLAGNAACAVQAMRIGRRAYGFQFHCEITATTVADWAAIPAYAKSLRDTLGPDGAAVLEAEIASKLPIFEEAARCLSHNLDRIVRTHDSAD